MIKIETMSADCVATVNDGPIFPGMILTHEDVETFVVSKGSFMYSVDETDLVTLKAEPAVVVAASVTPIKK